MELNTKNKILYFMIGFLVSLAITVFILQVWVKKDEDQLKNKSTHVAAKKNTASSIAENRKVANGAVTVIARQGNNNRGQRIGCGVVYDNDGHVITNRHIVENLENAFISVKGKEFKAKVVGSDKELDIAVLRVEEDIHLSPASFADSSKAKIGQPIVVMGKPFIKTDSYTLTSGIISSLPIDLPKGWPTLLTIDAVVNPGNSGGPVVDENGEVIAITTAYQSTGGQTQGLGFAIPINEVLKTVEEILENE